MINTSFSHLYFDFASDTCCNPRMHESLAVQYANYSYLHNLQLQLLFGLHVVLDTLLRGFLQHDKCHRKFPCVVILDTNNSRIRDVRVAQKVAFKLVGRYLESLDFDDFLNRSVQERGLQK